MNKHYAVYAITLSAIMVIGLSVNSYAVVFSGTFVDDPNTEEIECEIFLAGDDVINDYAVIDNKKLLKCEGDLVGATGDKRISSKESPQFECGNADGEIAHKWQIQINKDKVFLTCHF